MGRSRQPVRRGLETGKGMSFNELVANLTTQDVVVVAGAVFFALFFLGLVIRSWVLTQILNERAARTEALGRLERAKPSVFAAKPVKGTVRKPVPAIRSAVPSPRMYRYGGLKKRD